MHLPQPKSRSKRAHIHFLAILLLLTSTGCSTFNRDWKAAAAQPASDTTIEGAWEGEWRSQVNGHHGKLRCIVSRTNGGIYQARYKAHYWGILRFGYSVQMQSDGGAAAEGRFLGSADLGKLAGGIYHYEATITPTQFHSTYTNQFDHGTFRMERPSPRP